MSKLSEQPIPDEWKDRYWSIGTDTPRRDAFHLGVQYAEEQMSKMCKHRNLGNCCGLGAEQTTRTTAAQAEKPSDDEMLGPDQMGKRLGSMTNDEWIAILRKQFCEHNERIKGLEEHEGGVANDIDIHAEWIAALEQKIDTTNKNLESTMGRVAAIEAEVKDVAHSHPCQVSIHPEQCCAHDVIKRVEALETILQATDNVPAEGWVQNIVHRLLKLEGDEKERKERMKAFYCNVLIHPDYTAEDLEAARGDSKTVRGGVADRLAAAIKAEADND